MKQFKQLGWLSQVLLGFVLLSAMSYSNAMSVRERYLQQHPAARTEQLSEKTSSKKEVVHHGKHHEFKKHSSEGHASESVHSPHAIKKSIKKHSTQEDLIKPHISEQPIEAHTHQHKTRNDVQHARAPKLTPSQNDQQAREAEEALRHEPVQAKAPVQQEPVDHAAAKRSVEHHALHHAVHHHKHHRAE